MARAPRTSPPGAPGLPAVGSGPAARARRLSFPPSLVSHMPMSVVFVMIVPLLTTEVAREHGDALRAGGRPAGTAHAAAPGLTPKQGGDFR